MLANRDDDGRPCTVRRDHDARPSARLTLPAFPSGDSAERDRQAVAVLKACAHLELSPVPQRVDCAGPCLPDRRVRACHPAWSLVLTCARWMRRAMFCDAARNFRMKPTA
eukprot:2935818-Pleurochrysis_carterae.AAC.2